MGLQHVRIPGAVRVQFGVVAGADVLGRHVFAPRVAGCDFGVPVWNQDVVPVDVLAVHVRAAVPSVIKYVNVVKDGPFRAEVGQHGFGVAARRAGLIRGGAGTSYGAPVHPGPQDREKFQTRSQIREAVAGLQGPQSHEGPENEEREEEESHAGSPPEPCHDAAGSYGRSADMKDAALRATNSEESSAIQKCPAAVKAAALTQSSEGFLTFSCSLLEMEMQRGDCSSSSAPARILTAGKEVSSGCIKKK